MTEGDGLGIIVFFTFIAGIILGELKSRTKPKPINGKAKHRKKRRVDDDLNEFESDDIDADVDEMPDDSLIYDIFN
jgi:hypothetical protein